MKRVRWRHVALLLLGAGLLSLFAPVHGADPSPVQELRIQKVGDLTYFHVRLERPRDLVQDFERFNRGWFAEASPSLAPRLVAPDGRVRLVCQRFDREQRNRAGLAPEPERPVEVDKEKEPRPKDLDKDGRRQPRREAAVQGLEFVGRTEANGPV